MCEDYNDYGPDGNTITVVLAKGTCKPSCPSYCKGECGCKACHMRYQDFLSDDR